MSDDPAALTRLAQVLSRNLQRVEPALDLWQRLADRDPQAARPLVQRAHLLERVRRPGEAELDIASRSGARRGTRPRCSGWRAPVRTIALGRDQPLRGASWRQAATQRRAAGHGALLRTSRPCKKRSRRTRASSGSTQRMPMASSTAAACCVNWAEPKRRSAPGRTAASAALESRCAGTSSCSCSRPPNATPRRLAALDERKPPFRRPLPPGSSSGQAAQAGQFDEARRRLLRAGGRQPAPRDAGHRARARPALSPARRPRSARFTSCSRAASSSRRTSESRASWSRPSRPLNVIDVDQLALEAAPQSGGEILVPEALFARVRDWRTARLSATCRCTGASSPSARRWPAAALNDSSSTCCAVSAIPPMAWSSPCSAYPSPAGRVATSFFRCCRHARGDRTPEEARSARISRRPRSNRRRTP